MVNSPSNHIFSFNNYIHQNLVSLLLWMAVVNFKHGSVNSVPLVIEAPSANIGKNSLATENLIRQSGCRYKARLYSAGEDVPTDEPCLLCQCKNTATVCKLRICPDIPIPPPPGCIVVHKAKKCCPQLICQENNRKYSREHRLPISDSSMISDVDALASGKGYCLLDGTVYAEGSAMRSSTLCEYCFCIRGEMKCSSPQCVIPLNGCKPNFRSYACCPINYDCNASNGTAILKNIPSSTPIPQFLKGCQVNQRFVAEGEPVAPMQLAVAASPDLNATDACQTCFCMGGVVRCQPLECDRPIAGCRAITEDGHCCPDRYECDEIQISTSPSDDIPFTTFRSILPDDNYRNITLFGTPDSNAENEAKAVLPAVKVSAVKNGKAKNRSNSNIDNERNGQATAALGVVESRSDVGSREERRNKDGEDYSSRTFYDDDEKDEDMSALSFENRQKYRHSSLSFEETTDQSDSNSEMEPEQGETETDSPPTEETIRTETFVTESQNELYVNPSTATESISSLSVRSDDSVEKTSETTPPPEITSSTREEAEILNSTSNKASARPPQTLSSTLQEIKKILVASDPEIAALNLGSLSQTESPRTTTWISSEPKPTLEVQTHPSTSATTAPPASTKSAVEETTVRNVMFIPFGVEDAVHNPSNDSAETMKPDHFKIPSYDSHAVIKGSLIPPTPPKGYTSSTHKSSTQNKGVDYNSTKLGSAAWSVTNETLRKSDVNPMKDDFRNAIMDVPVSTSLYNNGYYKQGSIADQNVTDLTMGHSVHDLEMAGLQKQNISKVNNKTKKFEGHTFEDSDSSSFGIGEAIAQPVSLYEEYHNTKPSQAPGKTHKATYDFLPYAGPVPVRHSKNNETKASGNPTRTYSKFGMQDSTYYRYSNGGNVKEPQNVGLGQTGHHRYNNQPEMMHGSPHSHSEVNRNNANTFNKNYNPFSDFESYNDGGMDNVAEEESFENYQPKNTKTHLGVGTVNINASPSTSIFAGSPTNVNTGINFSTNKTPKKPAVPEEFVNQADLSGFKATVAFPFTIQKKLTNNSFNLGLKLSGCNIYGKMYRVGSIINELSTSCVRCRCTDVGVQCSELPC